MNTSIFDELFASQTDSHEVLNERRDERFSVFDSRHKDSQSGEITTNYNLGVSSINSGIGIQRINLERR
ncbi:MAG: hypothetical protein K2L35_03275 [Muribaculaceae bacterium]|nr:hypothetical protein [Muribaculaceae bacterium]MDE5958455.1 hypothetical protein [Muribaculaceae bacterium]MDE6447321.1 hypothetical protein [Muribaculaceae bacterium]